MVVEFTDCPMISSAFTCTGPYAVLIMLGIKRVENRSVMPELAKGRCAVGCSKSFSRNEFGNFVRWASRALPEDDFARIPAWSDVAEWPGKIVGACDYEANERGDGAWNEGHRFWWHLSNVVCFDSPIPCQGNIGLWQMPSALAAQSTAADLLAQSIGDKVASVEDARRILSYAVHLAGKSEGVFVLPLDADRRTISAPILVSLGRESTAVVQPKDIFVEAMKNGAEAIVVAHNHPSGSPEPSKEDIEITERLIETGKLLGIRVVDHLVLGSPASAKGQGFVSIRNLAFLKF